MKWLSVAILILAGQPAFAAGDIAISDAQREALQIETAPVELAERTLGALLPAKVAVPSAQLRVVTTPQQGLVERLLTAEGESVEAGQPLVQIQSPRLLELQGEYLETLTRHRLAATNYRRDRQLSEEGIIAQRRLLESRAAWQELDAKLARVRRLLELAGMDEAAFTALESGREPGSTLLVRAPFDGVVLEQMVEVGSRVEIADPIYRLAQLDPLWLEIHVPLDELGDTAPGQPVVVPALDVTGRVITVGHMVHGTDQGVLIRAEVHEGSARLRPGQFVQVRLAATATGRRYRVPRQAVVYTGGGSYVFVEQPAGFRAVRVTVADEDTDTLIIDGELQAGARIAVRGTVALKSAWQQGTE
jgi:RND family efflux transporter MFP subunit